MRNPNLDCLIWLSLIIILKDNLLSNFSSHVYLRMRLAKNNIQRTLFCSYFRESPRWLLTQGRQAEALKELKIVATRNRKTIPDKITLAMQVCWSYQFLCPNIWICSVLYLCNRFSFIRYLAAVACWQDWLQVCVTHSHTPSTSWHLGFHSHPESHRRQKEFDSGTLSSITFISNKIPLMR